MSIGPPRDSSSDKQAMQTYRKYINELTNRLQDDYVCAEELDLDDAMPQTPQSQQELSQNTHSRSHRGSHNYNGKVKDSMIELHCYQSTRGESDAESEESYYYADEESSLPMNPPSSRYQPSDNNFLIPSHVKLNPRANLYLVILLTCIITIASLVVGNGKSTPRSSSERAALFFSSTSLLIAVIIGFSFRYAPMRIYITRPYSLYEWYLGQIIDSREEASSIVLLISTFILCGIVMQPQANLAVTSNYKVLNSSLLYSTWVSVYTCVIIVADLFTQDASRWIIARDCDGDGGVVPSGYRPSFRSSALKAWFVSLFSNFAVSATLFSVCSSGLYEYENYRTKVMVGGFISLCGGLVAALMLALHHMVTTAQERAHSYGTWNSHWEGPTSQKHLISVGLWLGMVVLVLNCTIVGLICSAPASPGSIVFPSWVAFIVSVLLCKQYIESSLVAQPQLNKCSNDMCSDSDLSKGTHTTALESNYIDSCDDEYDTDVSVYDTNKRRMHDELMDRLTKLSASVAAQREPEEEIYTPKRVNAVPPTERSQQEPEEEVHSDFPGGTQDAITLSPITCSQASRGRLDPVECSPCSVDNEKFKSNIKTSTVPPPPPYPTRRVDSGKTPPSPRCPPPPPPPPPPFESSHAGSNSEGERTDEPIDSVDRNRKTRRKSKRASSRSDGFVRLSGKNPKAVDALVADALNYARKAKKISEDVSEPEESYIEDVFRKHRQFCRRRSSGVMSDSDESSEQRRAHKTELADLLKKVDTEFRHSEFRDPPKVSFSDRSKGHYSSADESKGHSASADRMKQSSAKTQRTKSKRQSLSSKSTASTCDPYIL